jgi:hypothetical protein
MEAKFGPLSLEVKQRVEALSPESLAQLQKRSDGRESDTAAETQTSPGKKRQRTRER